MASPPSRGGLRPTLCRAAAIIVPPDRSRRLSAQAVKSGALVYRQTGDAAAAKSCYTRMALMDKYHGVPTGVFQADEHYAGKVRGSGGKGREENAAAADGRTPRQLTARAVASAACWSIADAFPRHRDVHRRRADVELQYRARDDRGRAVCGAR
jgi:hypothetical protein